MKLLLLLAWLVVVVLASHVAAASAAFRPIPMVRYVATLPAKMDDFVIHSKTGDIACVSSENNKLYVFLRKNILANKTRTPDYQVDLGQAPSTIAFKRYKKMSYYGILSKKNSTFSIFNADDLTRVKTDTLGGEKSSSIKDMESAPKLISSLYTKDPFFYYGFSGKNRDLSSGAYDLRKMKDYPFPRTASQSSVLVRAISADGQTLFAENRDSMLYAESPTSIWDWSSSSTKPPFKRHCGDPPGGSDRWSPVTDPFNKYVTHGVCYTQVYEQHQDDSSYSRCTMVANLKFAPECFATVEPLLFGFKYSQSYDRPQTEIIAASYDSFRAVGGENLTIPSAFLRPISEAYQKGSRKRIKMMVNDVFSELVLAHSDRIGVVSYGCFKDLAAGLTKSILHNLSVNSTVFLVGKGQQLAQFHVHKSVTLDLGNLPSGARFDTKTQQLQWEPAREQVGSYPVEAKLMTGDGNTCSVGFYLNVSSPFYELPAAASALAVTDDESMAAVLQIDKNNATVSLFQLENKVQLTEKSFNFSLDKHIDFGGNHVIVSKYSPSKSTDKDSELSVYAFGLPSLDLVQTISISWSKRDYPPSLKVERNLLFVLTLSDRMRPYYIYNLTDMKPLDKNFAQPTWPSKPLLEGTEVNGILFNYLKTEAKLVLSPGQFVITAKPFSQYGNNYDIQRQSWLHEVHGRGGQYDYNRQGVYAIPGAEMFVQVEWKKVTVEGIRGETVTRYHVPQALQGRVLVYDMASSAIDDFAFVQSAMVDGDRLVVAKDHGIYIAHGNQLFSHSFTSPAVVIKTSLHFEARQTHFRIPREGKTQLVHHVSGGEGPYEVFDDLGLEGDIISVDEDSGTVTVSGARLFNNATETLVQFGLKKGLATVRAASLKEFPPWNRLPTVDQQPSPKSIPVGFPIFLRAVDRKGETAILRYFVYSEVFYDEVAPLIRKAQSGEKDEDDIDVVDKEEPSTNEDDDFVLNHVQKLDALVRVLIIALVVVIFVLILLVAIVAYKLTRSAATALPATHETDGLVKIAEAVVIEDHEI